MKSSSDYVLTYVMVLAMVFCMIVSFHYGIFKLWAWGQHTSSIILACGMVVLDLTILRMWLKS